MQMNVQLHHAVSDITGATGLRIVRAIVAGERDPAVLASFRDVRCKTSEDDLRAALTGNYRRDHVFCLQQALDLFDTYNEKIKKCDEQIELALKELAKGAASPTEPLPKPRLRKGAHRHDLSFDARLPLYDLVGVDLTQIHCMGAYTALRLVAECGDDMTRWPTAKHFTSWLTLCPGSKISGGKVLSSRSRKSGSRAATLLRIAAVNVGRTNSALGAFYRRLAARIGKAKAVTATARKLAVLFYNTLRYGQIYADPGATQYEERHRQRVIQSLTKKAKALGFRLADATTDGVS